MFCKSCDTWVNMASGIVQTVICDEKLAEDTRIEEIFYHTMEEVVSRLEDSTDVEAPVDNGRLLVTRDIDRTRVDPYSNSLFLFCGRRRDRIKALHFEKLSADFCYPHI